MSELDRNPSPPPELLLQSDDLLPDRVGESMFSRRWLIKILMDIIEAVNKEPRVSDCVDSQDSNSADVPVIELDPQREEDACALWDMCTNKDVACFLHEFKAEDIFLEVMDKTRSPRLLEIVVGVLGNMASFSDLCQDISKNEALLKMIISLTGSSDSPTIIQVLRLIHCGVVNEETSEVWLEALYGDSTFVQNICFILENSLIGELIKGALDLLYYVIDKKDDICIKWAETTYIKCMVASGKQLLSLNEFEAMDEFWLVMNLMFKHTESLTAFGEHFDELYPLYVSYLKNFCDSECNYVPPVHRVTSLAAGLATLAALLRKVDNKSDVKGEELVVFIKNLYGSVKEILEKGIIIKNHTENDEMLLNNENYRYQEQSKSSTSCNGGSQQDKLARSISLQEDDYDNISMLKDIIIELSTVMTPSILLAEDDVG